MDDRAKDRALADLIPLPVLYEEIEQRCRAVASARPTWPCQAGCDHCCRSLAEAPRLAQAEWRHLEEGLAHLDEATRATVEARLEEVAHQLSGPVICPFLDRAAGACRVYENRPAVCRTYGFYQSRDGGRFCHLVAEHTNANDQDNELSSLWESGLIWGSQDAIDRDLERFHGPVIPLRQWLDERLQKEEEARCTLFVTG